MSAQRRIALLALAAIGFAGGVIVDRTATAGPTTDPVASASSSPPAPVDCEASARIARPLFAPASAPTTGFRPRPPTDPDRARAAETCAGDPACVLLHEASDDARRDDALLGVVLVASRVIPTAPTATLRIAGGGDGLGVPRFASEASLVEGDEVPTLAGAVQVVAIRAHDPDTNVAVRFVGGRAEEPIDPMRFFVGPNVAAFAAGFHLGLEWRRNTAQLTATRGTERVEADVDAGTSLALGEWRYAVRARVTPSGRGAGWIELDARPTRAPQTR